MIIFWLLCFRLKSSTLQSYRSLSRNLVVFINWRTNKQVNNSCHFSTTRNPKTLPGRKPLLAKRVRFKNSESATVELLFAKSPTDLNKAEGRAFPNSLVSRRLWKLVSLAPWNRRPRSLFSFSDFFSSPGTRKPLRVAQMDLANS